MTVNGGALNQTAGATIAGTGTTFTLTSGNATLSGNNTYTGGSTLSAGMLQIGHANALGTSGTISLGGGTLQYGTGITTDLSSRFSTAASQAYNIDTNGNDVIYASALTSSGGALTKNGSGTLTLSANNTYTGATTINAGTLQIGAGGTTGSIPSTSAITNNGTLVINRSNAITISNIITGSGGVLKRGGTVTLSGNNSYTGGTTIAVAGDIIMGADNALGNGALIYNAAGTARLQLNGTNQTITNLSYGGSGVIENAGSGTGTLTFNIADGVNCNSNGILYRDTLGKLALVKTGNGTLDFSLLSESNTGYSGGLTVNGGTFSYNSTATTAALGMGNITLGGGTLNYAGSTARSITNNITLTAGTSSTLNNANSTITVSGSIGGSGNLTKSGAGTLVLSGANSYTGTTTVSAGNLTITSGTALADNGAVTLANTTGAVLSVSTSETIGSLSGGGASGGNVVIASAQTLTVNQTTNTTFSGAISGANLVKTGSGTLTVNGSNTYTGTTTVDSGTLQAATANALANTSQVVLNSGGSFLVTADDAIGTNTDIELNGGTLAFGAAGYDGYVGALTLSANSTIDLGTSTNGVLLRFTNINWNNPNALLSIYNWTGNTQYSGNPGGGLDQVVIGNATTTPLSPSQLQQINFYSGIEQSSFIANAFQITSGNYNREIIAVPEPETYLTGVILLLGGTIYLFRRAKNREGHRPAWPKFLLGIRRTTPRYHLAQKPPDPHRADT